MIILTELNLSYTNSIANVETVQKHWIPDQVRYDKKGYRIYLLCQQLLQCREYFAQILRLGAAGLGHVGTAATLAADNRGQFLNDVTGVVFAGQILRDHA